MLEAEISKNPLISVVILNYNGLECLQICLPSLFRQTISDFEIIVVDNGSTDNSVQYIKKQFPSIKTIVNKINTYAAGNNAGIRHARGDYILLLNNDVELAEDCLAAILKTIQNQRDMTGMWALKILNYYDKKIIDSTGLIIYRDGICRGRGRMESDEGQFDNKSDILMPSGCGGVYSKKMLDEIGLLDEDFQFYLEDSDLGFRGRLAGWKAKFIPDARVYHMYSATTGKYSPRKAYYIERNRIWFIIKLLPLGMILASIYYSCKRYTYQAVAIVTHKGSSGNFVKEYSFVKLVYAVCKGWLHALAGAQKMITKRKNISVRATQKEIKQWFLDYGISVKELSLKE